MSIGISPYYISSITMIGTTVTQKGQAAIPLPIRHKLGIQPGQKVFFEQKKAE